MRLRTTLAAVPRVVWWVTGLWAAMLVGYSLLLPTYRAPDEPHHADLAHVLSEEWHYPAWDERNLQPGLQRSLDLVFFNSRRSSHLTGGEGLPKGQRPSIEDLDDPPARTSINQNSQHPPLYYAIAGSTERVVEAITGGDLSYDVEVWVYRLVSIALVAPLPFIIWRLGRRLGLPQPVWVAAMLVPLAIPQLLHIGSAVNNDSLVLLTFWLLTPLVLRIGQGEIGLRTAALAGVVTGVAALTKGYAVALPLWVGAGLLTAYWRAGRGRLKPYVQAGAVYSVVAFAIGGWWWLRNLILYGNLAPSRFGQLLPPDKSAKIDYDHFLQTWAYSTTRRFWGDFGWFDTHIPALAFGTATVVVVAALVLALRRVDRVAGTAWGDRLLIVAPLLLLVVLQFTNALRAYTTTGRLPGLQGRYWFGGIAGLAVVVALGLAQLGRPALQRLPALVLVAAGVMQACALASLLGYYWGPPHASLTNRLRAINYWAPLPGKPLGVLGLVCAVAVLGAVVEVGRMALGGADEGPAPTDDDAPGSDDPVDELTVDPSTSSYLHDEPLHQQGSPT